VLESLRLVLGELTKATFGLSPTKAVGMGGYAEKEKVSPYFNLTLLGSSIVIS
jgi:hypothetical protein